MPDPDEVVNKELKEQEKLETAIGRLVLPILRRGAFEEEEPSPPPTPPGPGVASGTAPRPTVNKPTSPTSPPPQPAAAAPRPVGSGGPQAASPQRSTNRPAAPPAAAGGTSGKQPVQGTTGKLTALLATEDAPLRLGCEQVDLTIVSSP
jgi:hypothetical protein